MRWRVVVVAALLLVLGSVVPVGAQAVVVAAGPTRSGESVALSDDVLRAAVTAQLTGSPMPDALGTNAPAGQVDVEVFHTLTDAAARSAVTALGGTVVGSVPGKLVEAFVPITALELLEATTGISFVHLPARANVPAAGYAIQGTKGAEATSKTNADAWHTAGWNGEGEKIGVVDYFSGTLWDAAVVRNELPVPAATFCRNSGTACDIWASGIAHGQGVGEILYDMAPRARLYLATVSTASDLQAAVDWFAANGVSIISRSLGSEYDGPGNGTGPLATVVNNAVAKGMAWFNAAGNSGGTSTDPGSYWRGAWSDTDGDGWLNFSGTDELLDFDCAFAMGVRWSDWGLNRSDYDVYVFDDPGLFPGTWEHVSSRWQTQGDTPIEPVRCTASTPGDVDYLAIKLYAPGAGTTGDVLEFMTNGRSVQVWQNAYSANSPVIDSASAGMLAVGAVDPASGTNIATYSAQGPTNDGRVKPDISAASCISSFTFAANGCFAGTSAAAPVAAGAAALVLQTALASTPAALKTYLRTSAIIDRGVKGVDNVYGAGELRLPTPPVQAYDVLLGTGDLNGDAKRDLVGRTPTGTLRLLLGTGTGGFTLSTTTIGTGWQMFDQLVAPGDFSGDGKMDVIGRKPDGTLMLYPGTGLGTFGTPTTIATGWQVFDTVLAPGDFDRDGRNDLIGRKPDGTLQLYRGSGTGGFAAGPIQMGTGWGIFDRLVTPGDFNGDGNVDVIGRRADGALLLYPGNGSSSFAAAVTLGTGYGVYDRIIGVGDINGDAKRDLLVRTPARVMSMLRGSGTGGFLSPLLTTVTGTW